jgi:hypothetical protein
LPERVRIAGADFLPVIAITLLDRRGRSLDQFAIAVDKLYRLFHFANSLSPSRISVLTSAPSPALRAGGRHRRSGLRLAIAEIDQRRNCIADWLRRALIFQRAGEPHQRRIDIGVGGALSLSSVTMRSATLGRRRACAPPSPCRAWRSLRRARRLERAEDRERDLGANALHGLQQPEPFALDVGHEAEQADLVLAHIGFDRERRRLPTRGNSCSVRPEQ